MADLTPEQLAEIRARVDGATAAPWTVDDVCVVTPDRIQIADFEWLADTAAEWDEFKRNAAFVAAAREDVPALLAEVERLRAELATRTDERDEARRAWMKEHILRDKAEDERDRLAEQVRVLAGVFKRTNPTALCGAHPDGTEAGCEICRDAEIFRAAVDGAEATGA